MKIVLFTAALALATLAQANINVFPRHVDIAKYYRNGKPNTRITGGEEAEPHSRPWQVALFLPLSDGTAFCGGSLITTSTVVTAAHCVEGLTGAVQVILGAHKVLEQEDTQVKVNSSSVLIHPGWSSWTLDNDIALITLEEPVELNENIQTVGLPEDNSNNYEGELANVSGWGLDSDSATTISPILREVSVPVISNLRCDVYYLGAIQETNICTSGSDGKSTCSGDSGGPLVIDGVLVGIVSFGISLGCEVGWPSAYTRVSSYVDFINENKV